MKNKNGLMKIVPPLLCKKRDNMTKKIKTTITLESNNSLHLALQQNNIIQFLQLLNVNVSFEDSSVKLGVEVTETKDENDKSKTHILF